jgi:hypothetical protein
MHIILLHIYIYIYILHIYIYYIYILYIILYTCVCAYSINRYRYQKRNPLLSSLKELQLHWTAVKDCIEPYVIILCAAPGTT